MHHSYIYFLFVGLMVVAAVYYLKGFGPISPDDMNSFTTAVCQGIDRVSSEQVPLYICGSSSCLLSQRIRARRLS